MFEMVGNINIYLIELMWTLNNYEKALRIVSDNTVIVYKLLFFQEFILGVGKVEHL